jgi:hypothetical protein
MSRKRGLSLRSNRYLFAALVAAGFVIVVIPDPFATTGLYLSANQIAELEQDTTPVILPSGYDVLDIGASKGAGSILFLPSALKQTLGEKGLEVHTPKALGIDIDPAKVATCLERNQTCVQGNVLSLKVDQGPVVSGTTLWHVLEHMPTCDMAKQIWQKATETVREFASFHGPSFDHADVLRKAGFHRFYENWSGHRCHFDSAMLIEAIERSSPTQQQLQAYVVVQLRPIVSSESTVLLPNGAEYNSHHYDPSIHRRKPKKVTQFTDIYEEMRACAVYQPLLLDTTTTISLFTALALRDCLDPKLMQRYQGVVVKCRILRDDAVVHDNDECRRILEDKMIESIEKAKAELSSAAAQRR